MEIIDILASTLKDAVLPVNLLTIFLASFLGIIIGVLPGIGAPIGMALLLPFVFTLPPITGVLILCALWQADNYGSAITSILIRVPGSSSGIFTMIDGFPMAQQGKSRVAIGLGLTASAVGGVMGAVFFIVFAPIIAGLVTSFSAPEYFWLTFLGLTVIASVSKGNMLKGFICGGLGMMLAFIGLDKTTGFSRFQFGTMYFNDSLEFQIVALGIFAVGRLVALASTTEGSIAETAKLSGTMREGMITALKYPVTLIRSSIIGVVVGALPGSGSVVASALAYQQTVDNSKHPERFGKGEPEGVLAPETADNAVQGGSLVPTLALGIPGSTAAAIFLGALTMYGLNPGSRLLETNGWLVGTIFWAMILSIASFIILGNVLGDLMAKATFIPVPYLVPFLMVILMGGAYAVRHNILDLFVMVCFGVLGYFLEAYKYPLVPLVLGFILQPIAEENFFRAILLSRGSWAIFWASPISKVLIILILFFIFWPLFKQNKARRDARQAAH